MSGALLGLGLAQQLLDLLPRQVGPAQDAADAVAPGEPAERLENPLLELLDRPVVPGQAVCGRVSVFHRLNDLFYLLLGKTRIIAVPLTFRNGTQEREVRTAAAASK